MLSWFLFGILIGLCIRCICQPYKNTEEKIVDNNNKPKRKANQIVKNGASKEKAKKP